MTTLGAFKSDYERFKQEVLKRLELLEKASNKGIPILFKFLKNYLSLYKFIN